MQLGILSIILIFAMGYLSAILCLAGVALGGYMVYSTKRESHENLFGGVKSADAGRAESEFEDDDDLEWGTDVSKRNNEFLQKMRSDIEQQYPGE